MSINKLIELLENSINLIDKEIVTLKNEFVLYRIKVERLETKLEARLEELLQAKASKTSYVVALIGAVGIIIVGILELFKK